MESSTLAKEISILSALVLAKSFIFSVELSLITVEVNKMLNNPIINEDIKMLPASNEVIFARIDLIVIPPENYIFYYFIA
jgi:hypothetical protein